MPLNSSIETNGRRYEAPKNCAVVIWLDGCEPEYLDVAIEQGLMPNLDRIRRTGTSRIAHSVIPSFTNPNNMSIATGRPPSIHGICGNYLYEPETGEEVMMNDVRRPDNKDDERHRGCECLAWQARARGLFCRIVGVRLRCWRQASV